MEVSFTVISASRTFTPLFVPVTPPSHPDGGPGRVPHSGTGAVSGGNVGSVA